MHAVFANHATSCPCVTQVRHNDNSSIHSWCCNCRKASGVLLMMPADSWREWRRSSLRVLAERFKAVRQPWATAMRTFKSYTLPYSTTFSPPCPCSSPMQSQLSLLAATIPPSKQQPRFRCHAASAQLSLAICSPPQRIWPQILGMCCRRF